MLLLNREEITEFLKDDGVTIGPIAMHHWSHSRARIVNQETPILMPNTPTFNQAMHVDNLTREKNKQNELNLSLRKQEFVELPIIFHGVETTLPININFLRNALGLPQMNLLGIEGISEPPVFNDELDMEDINHEIQEDYV